MDDLKDQVKEALDAYRKANEAYLKAKKEANWLEAVYDELYRKYQQSVGIRVVIADDQFPNMTPCGVRILRAAVNETLRDPYFETRNPDLGNITVVAPEGLGPLLDLSEGCFDTGGVRGRVRLAIWKFNCDIGREHTTAVNVKMQIPESDDWLLHG